MGKLIACILLISLWTVRAALAAGPVIWNGANVKWLNSGLQNAGMCQLSSSGVMTAYTTNGIIKMSSGVPGAAASGTDYAPATSGSSILKGNGAGGFSNAASGTDYAPATATTSALKGNGSGGFAAAASTDLTDTANIDLLNAAQTYTAAKTNSTAGASSTPAMKFTGAPYTAGNATTNKPQVLLEWGSPSSAAWSTTGTALGVNAASAYTGDLLNLQTNGVPLLSYNYNGAETLFNPNDNASPWVWCGQGGTSSNDGCLTMYIASSGQTSFQNKHRSLSAISYTMSGGWVQIGGAASGHPNATLLVQNQSGVTTNPTMVVHTIASQTADAIDVMPNDTTVLFSVDPNGVASVQKIKVGVAVGAGATLVDGNGTGIYTGSIIAVPPCSAISASSIDWSLGNCFTKSLSANTTFTFTKAVAGQMITVRITDPSTYTLTWPNTAGAGTSVLWPGSVIPTQTTAGHTDIYTVFFDGTNFYGASPTQNY